MGTIRALADRAPHPERITRRARAGVLRFAACVAFALSFALPAWSGNLVQVRVGNHPTYTRVVFEFDAPSGYRIERRAAGESEKTILVTLDAASRERNITSKSKGVESINVDATSGRAVAHIMTRHAGLPIREMILTDPPRVVLDLMIPGTEPVAEVAEAKSATPAPVVRPAPSAPQADEVIAAEPIPEPEEIVAAEPTAQPALVEPEPEIIPEPLIEVPDLAVAENAASAEALADVEDAVAEAEAAAEAADDSVAEAAVDSLADDLADESAAEGSDEVAEEIADADAPLVVIELGDLMAASDAAEPDARRAVPDSLLPRESAPAARPIQAEVSDEMAPFDLKMAGMMAVVALALIVLVVLAVRSRGSKSDDDMDVTALAAECDDAAEADQASHEGRIPEGGFAMDADLHDGSPPDDDFEVGTTEAHDDENKPIESAGVATDAKPGLFDTSHQEEDAMSMDNQDLPTTHMDSEAPTQLGIAAAAIGADMDSSVSNLFQEFERRLAHMEARLDESNEARERLERQVEAQAEELRVQRAAIARTQRAVRSLNRPDEDQATEPALRDPSTPTS
jgi:hypothetical protein